MPSAQEYDLAIRLSMFDDVRCVPEVLIEQFACSGQISENWNRKIKGIKAIAKKYKHEYTIKDKVKTFGIVNLFRIAKIPGVGNKIYKIIIPIKKVYEKVMKHRKVAKNNKRDLIKIGHQEEIIKFCKK